MNSIAAEKALQAIRDMTTDCGVDRLMEIRRLADEALIALRAPQHAQFGVDDLHADLNDPNFGDYNIPPGGNHP